MLVVRKLDRKLPWPKRITKVEARGIPRRSFQMTAGADHRLSGLEELGSMTADAGVVIREVSDVGKVANLLPVSSGSFMAGIARLPMLFGRVGKS